MEYTRAEAMSKMQQLQGQIAVLTELYDALKKQTDAMDLVDKASASLTEMEIHGLQKPPDANGVRPSMIGQKPNVQIYEEVVRAHGQPMYASDVCEAALRAGLQLNGPKNSPKVQVTQALAASKRFVNVGDNTWWLADEPIPTQSDHNDENPADEMKRDVQETFLPT